MKIGVLGAGQLGRMLALAGYPLDMTFSFYDTSGAPSAGLGKIYSDPANTQAELEAFLAEVDVVTYEFEHLPLSLTQAIESKKPLHPLRPDRKSTRLNSSHVRISYAVFCLKKKKRKRSTK